MALIVKKSIKGGLRSSIAKRSFLGILLVTNSSCSLEKMNLLLLEVVGFSAASLLTAPILKRILLNKLKFNCKILKK